MSHCIFTGLWKHNKYYTSARGAGQHNLWVCPLQNRCNCFAQVRMNTIGNLVTLEISSMHTEASHANDKSKFLKHQQIQALKHAVQLAPLSAPQTIRRQLNLASPEKRIKPELERSVERAVREHCRSVLVAGAQGVDKSHCRG